MDLFKRRNDFQHVLRQLEMLPGVSLPNDFLDAIKATAGPPQPASLCNLLHAEIGDRMRRAATTSEAAAPIQIFKLFHHRQQEYLLEFLIERPDQEGERLFGVFVTTQPDFTRDTAEIAAAEEAAFRENVRKAKSRRETARTETSASDRGARDLIAPPLRDALESNPEILAELVRIQEKGSKVLRLMSDEQIEESAYRDAREDTHEDSNGRFRILGKNALSLEISVTGTLRPYRTGWTFGDHTLQSSWSREINGKTQGLYHSIDLKTGRVEVSLETENTRARRERAFLEDDLKWLKAMMPMLMEAAALPVNRDSVSDVLSLPHPELGEPYTPPEDSFSRTVSLIKQESAALNLADESLFVDRISRLADLAGKLDFGALEEREAPPTAAFCAELDQLEAELKQAFGLAVSKARDGLRPGRGERMRAASARFLRKLGRYEASLESDLLEAANPDIYTQHNFELPCQALHLLQRSARCLSTTGVSVVSSLISHPNTRVARSAVLALLDSEQDLTPLRTQILERFIPILQAADETSGRIFMEGLFGAYGENQLALVTDLEKRIPDECKIRLLTRFGLWCEFD